MPDENTSVAGGEQSPAQSAPQQTPLNLQPPQIVANSIPRKPKQDSVSENDPNMAGIGRKSFLSFAGKLSLAGLLGISTIGALKSMLPGALFESSTKFKAGYPKDYTIGDVNEKYVDEHGVWIVRETEGFYALIAACTHLGCTPGWLQTENKFKCPCHGSGYYSSGINFEGPAPRSLDRAGITLGDDGQIEVDKSVSFRYELGEWGKPGSYLPYMV
jgi:cytochrome b6-f complex iron-sulfur subunit